jgi:hypothetical protein
MDGIAAIVKTKIGPTDQDNAGQVIPEIEEEKDEEKYQQNNFDPKKRKPAPSQEIYSLPATSHVIGADLAPVELKRDGRKENGVGSGERRKLAVPQEETFHINRHLGGEDRTQDKGPYPL